MEITNVLYIVAAVSIVAAIWLNSLKKTDTAKFAGIVGIVMVVIAYSSGTGAISSLTAAPSVDSPDFIPGVLNGDCQVKGYTQLNFSGDTWGLDDPEAPAGSVDFYIEGVNPSDTGVNKLTTIPVTAGVGGLADGVLESCTNYGIIYNGASVEYDMWYNDNDWTQANQLPYVSTTESAIAKSLVKFNDILVIADIPDPIEEDSITGIINGQTNVSGESTSANEIQIGTDVTPADSDVIYYNKTNGDSSYYMDITLGAEGANEVLIDYVLCFVNDHSNPMDGDEWTKVTLIRQSGTDFNVPTDITEYVNSADCVPIADIVEGGYTGDYRMQFTAVNANLDVTTDVMYVYTDDMGSYLGKDILRNTKATAGAVMEMQFEA